MTGDVFQSVLASNDHQSHIHAIGTARRKQIGQRQRRPIRALRHVLGFSDPKLVSRRIFKHDLGVDVIVHQPLCANVHTELILERWVGRQRRRLDSSEPAIQMDT